MNSEYRNAAERLVTMARQIPDHIAIAEPESKRGKAVRNPYGVRVYRVVTFKELDRDSDRIAEGLQRGGLNPGMKIALMVRQGIDFITLVYALYKAGAVLVMIDPGMGIRRMLQCLSEVNPDGFAAIPAVQAARVFMRRRFPKAKINLTVGHRWFWGGMSLDKIRKNEFGKPIMAAVGPDDPAAIIFTSGSTGVAKGVLYTHGIINTQVDQLRERYKIAPGEIDLAGFPFFGLFDAALGVTTVIPDMDSTRPAKVDPELFLEAADLWGVTQSFGSPALWRKVTAYCLEHGRKMSTCKRAVSAGAPVPWRLLEDLRQCIHPEGDVHTPYGATESLPVASITATEVINETAAQSREGAGTCVGKRFASIEWRIIPISDGPIESIDDVQTLPPGEIGELAVTGPQVTREYVTRLDANALAKMKDSSGRIWHRMGDVGYIDCQDRFWFCGRKAHRVESPVGTFYSIPCEAIANRHPKVFRSALVGALDRDGDKEPVIVIEPNPEDMPSGNYEKERLTLEVLEILKGYAITMPINRVLIHPAFPVDVRHNAKINREALADWATNVLKKHARS